MSELVTITAKLVPYPKRLKAVPSFATAYFFEPSPEDDSGYGTLYAVIEVMAPAKQSQEVADLVLKTVGEHYYNHDDPAPTALERFEGAIKTVNAELARYTNKGNAGWVGRMSALIGLLEDGHLHLTQTGSAEAFLYRTGHASHISEGLSNKGPHRPIATFGQIASGQLQSGDRILLSTPALVHLVAGERLQPIIEDSNPNLAIQKLAELAGKHDSADRIAALVVEVTTPELLASQVRPDEPDEVQVGQPDSVMDTARTVAAPVVGAASKRSQAGLQRAHQIAKEQILPQLRAWALRCVQFLRHTLSQKRGRQVAAAVAVVVLILVALLASGNSRNQALAKQVAAYDGLLKRDQSAEALLVAGDKSGARSQLVSLRGDVATLDKSAGAAKLNARLAARPHDEAAPASTKDLLSRIDQSLDQIDGLVNVSPELVANLPASATASQHLELIGTRLVAVLSGQKSALTIIPTGGGEPQAVNLPSDAGQIVATSPNSAGDGLYILTSTPAVWLFKPDTVAFSRQTLSFGEWEGGKDIASYGGNIYILSDEQVWRHSPTTGGFSAKQAYLPKEVTPAGATSLAIDGTVYLGGGTSPLRRYLSGVAQPAPKDLPDALSHPKHLRIGGDYLVATDSSNRVGLYSTAASLSLLHQLRFTAITQLVDTTLDNKGQTLFMLADGKLLKAARPQ